MPIWLFGQELEVGVVPGNVELKCSRKRYCTCADCRAGAHRHSPPNLLVAPGTWGHAATQSGKAAVEQLQLFRPVSESTSGKRRRRAKNRLWHAPHVLRHTRATAGSPLPHARVKGSHRDA